MCIFPGSEPLLICGNWGPGQPQSRPLPLSVSTEPAFPLLACAPSLLRARRPGGFISLLLETALPFPVRL